MGIFLSLRVGSVGSTCNGPPTVVTVVPVATVVMVVTNGRNGLAMLSLATVFNRIVWTATAKL